MLKDLMHSILSGSSGNQAAIAPGAIHAVNNPNLISANLIGTNTISTNTVAGIFGATVSRKNKTLFSGHIEVTQVNNGYIVRINTREGYDSDCFIAQSVTEVNEIISSQMVAFKLEDKK